MSKRVNVFVPEDTIFLKPQTWVFDERLGWVDVKEFLVKVRKLSESLTVKTNKSNNDNPGVSV